MGRDSEEGRFYSENYFLSLGSMLSLCVERYDAEFWEPFSIHWRVYRKASMVVSKVQPDSSVNKLVEVIEAAKARLAP